MSGFMGVLSYGIGTLLGISLLGLLVFWFIQDVTQKKHTRAAQLPGDRPAALLLREAGRILPPVSSSPATATRCRSTAPRAAGSTAWPRTKAGIIGFGSTNDLREPGSIIFVNAPFPVLEEDRLPTPSLMIGEGYCRMPFEARSHRQHQRHELRRDLRSPRCGRSRAARRWPAAGWTPAKAACRRTTWKAAATSSCRSAPPSTASAISDGQFSPSARSELGAGREGLRDQAVAGREARQGRRAAGEQGDRGDRAHPRHSRRARIRSAPTAIATSPTSTSCSTRSP